MKKLKIVFFGTESFSAEHLNALIISSYNIKLVISQPDQRSGRGQKINFSPVKKLSIQNKIPIFQPTNLNDKTFQNKLSCINANIMIVVSYGKIIPQKVLKMFSFGAINIHPSLLPRWRGATPIQSAILYGDKKTGITVIKMDNTVDTGNILHVIECNISNQDTTYSLSLKLIKIGIQALLNTLEKITSGIVIEKKQNATNAVLSKKIHKNDAVLNWDLEAIKLERAIRAFNPWPVCYFLIKNIKIKVWQAKVIPVIKSNYSRGEIISCNKEGIQINTYYQILNIEKIQLPGKKIMHVQNIIIAKKSLFKIGSIIK